MGDSGEGRLLVSAVVLSVSMPSRPPTADAQSPLSRNSSVCLPKGDFTATYKFALLISLADLAVELGTDDGQQLDFVQSPNWREIHWPLLEARNAIWHREPLISYLGSLFLILAPPGCRCFLDRRVQGLKYRPQTPQVGSGRSRL